MSIKPASFSRVSDPETEPVTLDEVKVHLRLDSDLDDDYLSSLIKAAREWAEDFTGRVFITQTWRAKYGSWPSDRVFVLPAPPVQSVESITYVDADDADIEVDSDLYNLELNQTPALVQMTQAAGAPTLSRNRVSSIVVELTCGYGDEAVTTPERVKSAMKLTIAHWYFNRVSVNVGNIVNKVPLSAEALLTQLRIRPT